MSGILAEDREGPVKVAYCLVPARPSALTSVNANWTLPCLRLASDHDCPCVTVVGRCYRTRIARRAFVLPDRGLFVPN